MNATLKKTSDFLAFNLRFGHDCRAVGITLCSTLVLIVLGLAMPGSFAREDGPLELAQVVLLGLTSLVAFSGFLVHTFIIKSKNLVCLLPWQGDYGQSLLAGLAAITTAMGLREVSSCGSAYAEVMCLPHDVKSGLIVALLLSVLISKAFSWGGLQYAMARLMRRDIAWIIPFSIMAVGASFVFEELEFTPAEELFELALYGVLLVLASRLAVKAD